MEVVAAPFVSKLKASLAIAFLTKLVAVMLLIVFSLRDQSSFMEKPKRHPTPCGNSAGHLYSDYFETAQPKVKTSLLVVVLSALGKFERRNMIRRTWWQDCKRFDNVTCMFMIDSLEGQEKNIKIKKELATNNDMLISPVKPGLRFGHRVLYAMQWAMNYYDFKYLIRADDDVLLCIEHLLHRMNSLPTSYFMSGYLHCQKEGIVYIDEGIVTFSQDVVRMFLSQKPNDMYCHTYGDQTYSTWIKHLNMDASKLYHDETRIHHHPPASRVDELKNMTRICYKYIALHGVYGSDMLTFWSRRFTKTFPIDTGIRKVKDICPFKPTYDWRKFEGMYGFEPKLCNDHRAWAGIKFKVLFSRE